MPELPEVEIAKRNVLKWTRGRRLLAVEAPRSRVLGATSPAAFERTLRNARVTGAERRGKNVVLALARGREAIGLRFHLGMTGKFVKRNAKEAPPRFARASFRFEKGVHLHYLDMRLFGQLEAGPLQKMRDAAFAELGPDPLADGLDGKTLGARIGGSKLPVKLALMDQTKLAGVGNILASESLWRARISPKRKSSSLKTRELEALAKGVLASIAHTLDEEESDEIEYVEEGGDNPFIMYARAGERCPRCRKTILRFVQGGRSTFWCKGCQK